MQVKAWLHTPHESWIVDWLVSEFSRDNPHIVTTDRAQANVLWYMAGWCIDQLEAITPGQKVVSTVHHLVPDKHQQWEHVMRNDHHVDAYHVPNVRSRDVLATITKKPIYVVPYWASSQAWSRITPDERRMARASLGIGDSAYVIASFQRDTEGRSGDPKLEKGPDILCDYIERIAKQRDVTVLLAGYRRQYVMGRLDAAGIRYIYIERAPGTSMRWLYAAADLYVVASRCEGGPQALLECAALGVPVISTPVGMAEVLLHPMSISHDLALAMPNVEHAAIAVRPMLTPHGYEPYISMLAEVVGGKAR
jgi:glycosyltransferase involved in cell wall biosynthesis